MKGKNSVFIASSIDGHIADKNNGLSWLDLLPEINQIDTGYNLFMSDVDALVMGRNTFETVLNFGIEWPYSKPVFVLSTTLTSVPEHLQERVFLISGNPQSIVSQLHEKGFFKCYIDGGKTIQSFLKADLIDEIIVTTIPILLGGGPTLFGDLHQPLEFKLKYQKEFLGEISQRCYVRKRASTNPF
jgi:dihydrofolate reductase